MNVYYSNGTNEFFVMLRFMDKETAYVAAGESDIEEIKVNGYDAILSGKNLTVLIGDVEYGFRGNGAVSSNELIKVAESLK